MDIRKVKILGMILDEITYKSSTAHFGEGKKWASLYDIESKERNKGHATELLKQAKWYYKNRGKILFGTVPLNDAMKRVYDKVQIEVKE